jgi:hypothetical protein
MAKKDDKLKEEQEKVFQLFTLLTLLAIVVPYLLTWIFLLLLKALLG